MESPNTLIIFYDVAVGKEPLLAAIAQYNATVVYDLNNMNSIVVRIPDETKIDEAIEFFNGVNGVLQVNRDRANEIDTF